MSVPRPVVDDRARELLDAVTHPLSIASAVRDARGAIVDFAFVFVNRAAGEWSGIAPEAVVGARATDLVPSLRPAGLFDALARVVETGEPFQEAGQWYEGPITGGLPLDGRYDLVAVRLGDGYLSAWRRISDDDAGSPARRILEDSVRAARDVVRLVRLEARSLRPAALRLQTA